METDQEKEQASAPPPAQPKLEDLVYLFVF